MGFFDIIRRKRRSLPESGVLEGLSDRHSHILPGVDDGVRTLEEALQILSYYETLGIREVWCTPHVMEDVPNSTASLKSRFEALQKAYHGPVILHLAAEYMLDPEFESRLENGDLLTQMNDIVLVETSYDIPPYNLTDMLERMMANGYRPMMAHPERNNYMQMPDYRRLHDMGVHLQLNLGSLSGYYGENVRKKSFVLLKEGLYNAAGSDCHSLRSIRHQFENASLSSDDMENLKKIAL